MSRLWAGVGAVAGVAAGSVVGSEIATARALGAIDPINNAGFLVGALVGAFTGAAIGAGGWGVHKQIGTAGVGALPSNMGGGMFP